MQGCVGKYEHAPAVCHVATGLMAFAAVGIHFVRA